MWRIGGSGVCLAGEVGGKVGGKAGRRVIPDTNVGCGISFGGKVEGSVDFVGCVGDCRCQGCGVGFILNAGEMVT